VNSELKKDVDGRGHGSIFDVSTIPSFSGGTEEF
jgi:hypothetical protein